MNKAFCSVLIVTVHLISFLLLIYGATAFNVNLLDTLISEALDITSIASIKYVLFLLGITGSYFTIHILAKSSR